MSDAKVWSTKDEIKALDYIASHGMRANGQLPTVKERRNKLKAWLKQSKNRKWNRHVDIYQCQDYAEELLTNMGGKL